MRNIDPPTAFSSSASWIWGTTDTTTQNIWRYFRRGFEVPANLQRDARHPVRLRPSFTKIRIAPQPFHLKWASGSMLTPLGLITVSWQKDVKGRLTIQCDAPADCEVQNVYPLPNVT